MNITELRELDAWIAEHVLGWKWYKYLPEDNHAYSGCRTLANSRHKYLVKASGGEPLAPDAFYNTPKPTTNPADAMLVLEKCVKHLSGSDGGGPALALAWLGDAQEAYQLTETDTGHGAEAVSASLPLAICQFAKALFSK